MRLFCFMEDTDTGVAVNGRYFPLMLRPFAAVQIFPYALDPSLSVDQAFILDQCGFRVVRVCRRVGDRTVQSEALVLLLEAFPS